MKICKKCGAGFEVAETDKASQCADCKRIQLMNFRNERTFYNGTCKKCGNRMVSCFSSNSPFQIWCSECWWSDKFDPLKYGKDFDFNRPFFDQFWELMMNTPLGNLFIASSENSDYANYSVGNKNSYMLGASDYNEDSFYVDNSNYCRNACDISFVNKSELIYQSVDLVDCYMCLYCQNLKNCNFYYFCADSIGCANCVGCVNLRNKQYCIFNKQYSREEYETAIKDFAFETSSGTQKFSENFCKFLSSQPHRFSHNINSQNCAGDYIVNSKNCKNCFDVMDCEDCDNLIFGYKSRNCRDVYGTGTSELIYNSAGISESYDVKFSCLVWPGSSDVWYSLCARNAKHCFGCVSLRRNEYCILNKQYSKEEYEKLFEKIKTHMIKTGEFGEYFPLKYAPWSYNETIANDFYPRSKEEILSIGGRFEENLPGTFNKGNLKSEKITDNILECSCGKNYKIIQQEFNFYKKIKTPIPRKCPSCRYKERFSCRNSRKLFVGKCAECANEFETTYAPNFSGKILCEDCYNKKVT